MAPITIIWSKWLIISDVLLGTISQQCVEIPKMGDPHLHLVIWWSTWIFHMAGLATVAHGWPVLWDNSYLLWVKLVLDLYIHYYDVIMGAVATQITSLTIVYSTVYSDADQRTHQSPASLAFVRGIHRGPGFHLMTSSCEIPFPVSAYFLN